MNYYTALAGDATASTDWKYVHIRYADHGIQGRFNLSVSDSQFVNCVYPFFVYWGPCYLTNDLLVNVGSAFYGNAFTATAYHLTIDGCANNQLVVDFWGQSASTVTFINSLLVNVGSGGDATITTNHTAWVTDSSGTNFQTVGAGSCYLSTNSLYHMQGTTNIDPATVADIATKTTYPPIVYSNTIISVATNLSPQAWRDTNAMPDLGYHYDPLDYVFGGVEAQSNLTFAAGTAVGWFDPWSGAAYGIILDKSVTAAFNGTATAPCWLARYDMVQEGGNGNWTDTGCLAGIIATNPNVYYSSTSPQLNMQFTKCSSRNFENLIFRDIGGNFVVNANDCEFYGPLGGYNVQFNFTNCLFFRCPPSVTSSSNASPSLSMQNCTTEHGEANPLCIQHWGGATWPVSIRDCTFDGTTISMDDYSGGNIHAFLTNADRLAMWGTHDVTNIISFNWQSSWFGNYYLPIGSQLLGAGGVTANQVGLYHFTTQTNQVPETNSIVDIGYHYVVTDTNGVPLDANGNGIPDYLEDANGDGVRDNGETNWALTILVQPTNLVAVVGTSPTISVTAGGIAPITYQWYSTNSGLLPGTTSNALTFSNVQTNSDGGYFVVVTNNFGSLTSFVAVLTVVPPPTVTITNPVNNAIFATSSADITLRASASDTNSQVQFFQGTTSLGIVTSPPYTVVWSTATPGNYALTAVATDNGLTATSPVVNVTISPVFETNTMTLWLKADSITHLTNNSPVSIWVDSSGWTNSATQSTPGNRPSYVTDAIHGYPVVHFNPTNNAEYLQTANGFMNSATGIEAIMVLRVTIDPPTTAEDCWDDDPNNNPFSGNANEQYPNVDGSINQEFGTYSDYYLGVPAQLLTQYHIFEVASQSNNWSAWINGVLLYYSSANTFGLEYEFFLGSDHSQTPFSGDIAEVFLFNRGLTLNESAVVNAYLNGKYGLVPFVPATPSNLVATAISTSQIGLTWNKSLNGGATQISIERSTNSSSGFAVVAQVADTLSYVDTNLTEGTTYYYQARATNVNTWSPYSNETNATTLTSGADIPFASLVLWLKADSGLAQIGTNTPVSSWVDQSGDGNNVIQASANTVTRKSGTNEPVWVLGATSGFPVVHFTATNSQYQCLFTYNPINGMVGATNVEAFAVLRVTTNHPAAQRGLWYYAYTNTTYEDYPATNGWISDAFGSGVPHSFNPTNVVLTNYHIYEVLSQSNNWSAWINGILQYSTNNNTVAFGSAFDIGAVCAMDGYDAPIGNPFDGDVAEVLIFNQALTAAQRATVITNYLFSKYDISLNRGILIAAKTVL